MTDPGAELKAFEDRARYFVLTNHGWEDPVEISLDGAVEIVTAFAAKEVARVGEKFTKACWELSMMQQRAEKAEKVAMAVAVLLRAKCTEAEWEAFPDELTSVADDSLARAVEEERMACLKIVTDYEASHEIPPDEFVGDEQDEAVICHKLAARNIAISIHERSQVKGEGL